MPETPPSEISGHDDDDEDEEYEFAPEPLEIQPPPPDEDLHHAARQKGIAVFIQHAFRDVILAVDRDGRGMCIKAQNMMSLVAEYLLVYCQSTWVHLTETETGELSLVPYDAWLARMSVHARYDFETGAYKRWTLGAISPDPTTPCGR